MVKNEPLFFVKHVQALEMFIFGNLLRITLVQGCTILKLDTYRVVNMVNKETWKNTMKVLQACHKKGNEHDIKTTTTITNNVNLK